MSSCFSVLGLHLSWTYSGPEHPISRSSYMCVSAVVSGRHCFPRVISGSYNLSVSSPWLSEPWEEGFDGDWVSVSVSLSLEKTLSDDGRMRHWSMWNAQHSRNKRCCLTEAERTGFPTLCSDLHLYFPASPVQLPPHPNRSASPGTCQAVPEVGKVKATRWN